MNRHPSLGQSLTDLGNIAIVHHLPDLISLWPYSGRVMVQVHANHLEAYRSALRGEPITTEPHGVTERVSTTANTTNGAAVEVYAYTA